MLEALSVDAASGDALFGQPFRGRVHSVFAKAINFTDSGDRLFCLAAEELDDAPGTVRVRHPAGFMLDNIGITPGDAVASAADGLVFGRVRVTAGRVRPWAAPLPPFPSQQSERRRLAANLTVLRTVIGVAGQDGGMKAFLAGNACTVLERELAERAAVLAGALAAGEMDSVLTAGRRLIGLGTGLTPSGDDFLAGLMIIFNMPAGPFGPGYRVAAATLAAGAETGTVSRAMLDHAARGRTRASVLALLAALTGAEACDIEAAVRPVLVCGGSSGTDLAVGLAVGLTIGQELAGEREE